MKQSHYLGSSVLRYGYPKTTVQHTPCRVLFTRTHSSPEQHAYLRRYLGYSYSTRFTRGGVEGSSGGEHPNTNTLTPTLHPGTYEPQPSLAD